MHHIDLHVIHYDEPQWVLDRCIASLEGQPVNIHIVQGVKEFPPIKGRQAGYVAGTAPYATYVDPDDEVMPGAVERLLVHYGADLIWGNELVKGPDGMEYVAYAPHHLVLRKREKTGLNIKRHVNEVLYVWNMARGTRYNRLIMKRDRSWL